MTIYICIFYHLLVIDDSEEEADIERIEPAFNVGSDIEETPDILSEPEGSKEAAAQKVREELGLLDKEKPKHKAKEKSKATDNSKKGDGRKQKVCYPLFLFFRILTW